MDYWIAQAPMPPTVYWLDGWITPTTLPTWVAGGIAVVALAFAIRSSNAGRRSAEAANGQLRRLEDQEARVQPAGVHAWLEALNSECPPEVYCREWLTYTQGPQDDKFSVSMIDKAFSGASLSSRLEGRDSSFRLRVANLSDGPIFDVFVEQVGLFAPLNMTPQARQANSEKHVRDMMTRRVILYVALLPAGQATELFYSFVGQTRDMVQLSSPLSVAFTDCFGRRWARKRSGVLSALSPTENPEWVAAASATYGRT
jgi:hypothetical protein